MGDFIGGVSGPLCILTGSDGPIRVDYVCLGALADAVVIYWNGALLEIFR